MFLVRINRILKHMPNHEADQPQTPAPQQNFAVMPSFFMNGMSPEVLASKQWMYQMAQERAKAAAELPACYRRMLSTWN